MSKKDKLLSRFLSKPTDFTFDEMATILKILGFLLDTGGKTSGSAVSFKNKDCVPIRIHKPHPNNVMKPYQIADAIKILKEANII